MFKFSTLLPLLVGASTLVWSVSQAQTESTATNVFAPVTQAISTGNLDEAAHLLKQLKADGLEGNSVSRWENLAARVAIRQGDAVWLSEINRDAGLSTGADEIVVISAMRLIFANRLTEARAMLSSIKEPDYMSEIPRRRYEELWLKLEQLSGDKKAEAEWAEKLVNFTANWDKKNCQSCHANPKEYGKEVTHFDLNNWWIGERYTTLLQANGEAEAVAKAARAALATNENDKAARIRLGYALRALNQSGEAEKQLRQISWGKWDDKPYKKPLRLSQFP